MQVVITSQVHYVISLNIVGNMESCGMGTEPSGSFFVRPGCKTGRNMLGWQQEEFIGPGWTWKYGPMHSSRLESVWWKWWTWPSDMPVAWCCLIQSAGIRHGFLPRMTRLAVLHEVLWWMMYGGKPEDLDTASVQNDVSHPCLHYPFSIKVSMK